jgi:hypothetical protein
MIRVRYKDLSPGSHGMAERSARRTTVYLLPGLTGGQRRAALRRLRQEASRGCGPELRGPDLAVALAADRFRVGVRNTAAVVRLHPAGSLLPTALAAALMALFVFASVSVRMVSLPQSAPPGGLVAVQGAPTMAASPVLARARLGRDQGSVAHRLGAGYASARQGAPSSLAPSSLVGSSPAGSAAQAGQPGPGWATVCRHVGSRAVGQDLTLADGQDLTLAEAWACGPRRQPEPSPRVSTRPPRPWRR